MEFIFEILNTVFIINLTNKPSDILMFVVKTQIFPNFKSYTQAYILLIFTMEHIGFLGIELNCITYMINIGGVAIL